MVCDKCKKRCTGNWIPGVNYPKYKIEETTGMAGTSPIYLCYNCSIKFKNWLYEDLEKSVDIEE